MTHISLRVDADLADRLDRVAERTDTTRSDLLRSLIRDGLADLDTDGLDGEAARSELEQIKTSEYRNKRAAWYRSNAGGRLLTLFNSGLSPDEAETAMRSYVREALELLDDREKAEWVREGLDIYRAAHPDAPGLLASWVKDEGTAHNVREVDVAPALDGGAAEPDALGAGTDPAALPEPPDPDPGPKDTPRPAVAATADMCAERGIDPADLTASMIIGEPDGRDLDAIRDAVAARIEEEGGER